MIKLPSAAAPRLAPSPAPGEQLDSRTGRQHFREFAALEDAPPEPKRVLVPRQQLRHAQENSARYDANLPHLEGCCSFSLRQS